MKRIATSILLSGFTAGAFAFVPGQTNWFVGIDNLTTLPSGPFTGMANPNFGKMTLLYGHQYPEGGSPGAASSHFHAKSSVRLYRETVGGPILTSDTAVTVNGTTGVITGLVNFVPETAGLRIRLGEGSGAFSGKYATGFLGLNTEWENMEFRPVSWLNRPGASTAQVATYNTSGGRYTGSVSSIRVGLKIESLTGGLEAWHNGTQYSAGQVIELGMGDFSQTPVFAASTSVGQGTQLNASVRLVDLDNLSSSANSGTTEFRFQTVPEPASMAAIGLGVIGLLCRRRK